MKFLDQRNKSFTVLRVMQGLKILSFTLQYCYIWNRSIFPKVNWSSFIHQPLSLITSIFHETNSFRDFLSLSICVYPALTVLERITTISTSSSESATFYFYGIAFVLMFIIGGIANLVAAYFINQRVGGMKGSIAAFLGYMTATKPKTFLLEGLDLRAGDALFATFAVTFMSSLLGISAVATGEWEMSNILSWAFGGLLGYALGEYHLENLNVWKYLLFS
mmetsp:Transcript_2543/g.3397  ORF Transcript_2543/g.3397 Transcript_2543/m.3397 type:complete len:220 (-) Transcript_2543:1483-2142(-)